MADQRTTIEVIAPTVEEAVQDGLAELGLNEENVEIEVLDQGSRGLFGLGTRNARVKLSVKQDDQVVQTLVETELESGEDDIDFEAGLEIYSEPESNDKDSRILEADATSKDLDHVLRVSADIVKDLLDSMKVRAQVSAHFVQAEDDRHKAPVWVDVNGKDLSILIGPRAETLNALQYIAGLIISKELGKTIPLIVDVEGYRARRESQLRNLARRMADQAIKTGRRQVLEPMTASDRRIVHLELRNNPEVFSESVGEEPRRKVTIIPK